MQNNTNSIDNYRQQIQKRISQLQSKLKSRNGTRVQQYKDNNKKSWQEGINLKDEPIKNRIINSINLSGQKNQMKISQNKGLEISRHHQRIKENEKFQRNENFQKERTNQNNNYINERQAKSPIKNSHKKIQNRASNKKQECMDELYEMMNKILQGQKTIEMEIIQLKNDVSKDSTLRKVSEIELSKENQVLKEKENYKDDSIEDIKVGCKTNVARKKQNGVKGHNTFKKRSYSTRKNKKQNENDLTELMELVKNQRRRGERIIVGEELTANIWKDIEMRIMQSQRQYKDTIHRNNKHEHEHLINTYQLQKKLKDQLIQKIYQQCNQGIYK